ncbi:MAG: CoA transferase [Burkholderiaceae bacterium]|nr:CoA transferase [Burkholderiaceae bacterium]
MDAKRDGNSKRPDLLEKIRVIDISSYVAGPSAAAILADLGADVIHVEPLGGDPMRSVQVLHGLQPVAGKATPEQINSGFELVNRNKRGIALNITCPAGLEVLRDLVREADVFITNLLPERLASLQLEYAQLRKINPRLIYAGVTGYGTNNPERNRRAFDVAGFWARAGLMESISEGNSEKPYMRGGMGDQAAGMGLAGAIGFALFQRERTGEGQQVDVSLFRTGVWILGSEIQRQFTYGAAILHGSRVKPNNPMTNYYQDIDGKWFVIHMSFTDRFWPRLCETLGRPELSVDPRFSTHAARERNSAELVAEFDRAFAAQSREEWGRRLDAFKVVWSPIQTLAEVEQDPLLEQEDMVYERVHPATGKPYKILGLPFTLSNHTPKLHLLAPRPGEHTDAVLSELGYDAGKISALRSEGVLK